MDKHYDHAHFENKMYQLWEKADSFNPDSKQSTTGKSFCILMPPPNANDPLHIGHAMFVALEDIMIRYHRMLGDDTLWLPGTDHAGIETQFLFEKKLKKKGKSRFNYDRQTLYQMIWDYVQQNSDIAVNQLKKIGASADWSRFKFMLADEIVAEVLKTFHKLNKQDLIYRDLKLVNYCPKCGTAFSELEVDHEEKESSLYYMKYGPFIVATTRPETIFGDTAVAVNPNDKRYQQYIGQEIEVDYLIEKRKIKVIADNYVDPEFGTGALKITPLHDPNDYEVWQRHKNELPQPKQIIDYDGRLNNLCGKYERLKTHMARKQVVQDLEKAGLLEKVDQKYKNSIGVCYRCGTTIEPLPLAQFFVRVKPLVEKVLQKLDGEEVIIHGTGYDKILKHWLHNLKDWNISRQIVWGIRLPVWYDVSENPDLKVTFIENKNHQAEGELCITGNIKQLLTDKYDLATIKQGLQELRAPITATYVVANESPGENYIQETDTFDTWFSSGQWPFTTLKTSTPKNKSKNQPTDFERFYPTQVMETAYDILMFWVMRMLMMSLFETGQVPFKNVYLHGLVRDPQGRKMSKSKGNTINPLEVIEKYGADALRMALVIRSTPGLDKSVGEQDFKAMRNLTNKLWNATRYIVISDEPDKTADDLQDQAFLDKLEVLVAQVTKQLNELRLGLAAETLYNEFWHWFCDESIELSKQGKISKKTLMKGLHTFIKLFHPFIPFVTEAIWQELKSNQQLDVPTAEKLLITTTWPK